MKEMQHEERTLCTDISAVLTQSAVSRTLRDAPVGLPMHSVAFSSDGSLVAVGTGCSVSLWNLEDGSHIATLPSPLPSADVAFHLLTFIPGTPYLAGEPGSLIDEEGLDQLTLQFAAHLCWKLETAERLGFKSSSEPCADFVSLLSCPKSYVCQQSVIVKMACRVCQG